jgi:hypothetical protein
MNTTTHFRNWLIALVLVLIGTMAPANQAQAQVILSDEQLIRRAITAIEARDFLSAAMYLQAYIQRNPGPMRTNAEHAEKVKAALTYSIEAVRRAITCRTQTTVTCGINEEGLLTSISLGFHGGSGLIVHYPPSITVPPSNNSQSGSNTSSSATSATGQTARQQTVCPGAPTRLQVDAHAFLASDSRNNVRSQPNTNARIIGQIQPGEAMRILDGPRCAGRMTWWFVESAQGVTGWTSEGSESEYWLAPLN